MFHKNVSFSKQYRLNKPVEYKFVFDKAKRFSNSHFTVLVRMSDIGHARLGLIVAKKNVKRAADRNRVKRRIRETFRLNQPDMSSFDIVVLAKRGVASLPDKKITESLVYLWNKVIQCGQS